MPQSKIRRKKRRAAARCRHRTVTKGTELPPHNRKYAFSPTKNKPPYKKLWWFLVLCSFVLPKCAHIHSTYYAPYATLPKATMYFYCNQIFSLLKHFLHPVLYPLDPQLWRSSPLVVVVVVAAAAVAAPVLLSCRPCCHHTIQKWGGQFYKTFFYLFHPPSLVSHVRSLPKLVRQERRPNFFVKNTVKAIIFCY